MPARRSLPPQGVPDEFAALLRRLHDDEDPLLNLILAAARDAGWRTPALAATIDMRAAAVSKRVERARRAVREPGLSIAESNARALRRLALDITVPAPHQPQVTLDGKQLSTRDIAQLKQWQAVSAKVNGAMPPEHQSRRVSEQFSAELNRLITQDGFTPYYLARVLGVSHRAITSRLERHHFRVPPPSVAGTPSGEYRNRKIGDPPSELSPADQAWVDAQMRLAGA